MRIPVGKTIKKLIFILLTVILSVVMSLYALAVSPTEGLSTPVTLIMDADTGQVLYQSGMNERMYPASITKIMTALLTLEHVQTDEIMTMSREATHSLVAGASHIALTTDERISVLDGLYALMLPSANDAANGLAEHVSGSMDDFNILMNERAQDLGATGTNFSNAHGLYESDHYTTAHDMALITQQAIKDPLFCEIWGTLEHTIPATNLNYERDYIRTQVDMLNPDSRYYYPDCTGGKMGWVPQSKYTAVMTAERDGRTLIGVLMGNDRESDLFEDAIYLFDYAFENTALVTLTADDIGTRTATAYEGDMPMLELSYGGDIPLWLDSNVSVEDIEILWDIQNVQTYMQVEEFARVVLSLGGDHDSGQYSKLGVFEVPLTQQEILGVSQSVEGDMAGIMARVATPGGIALVLLCVAVVGYILWCKVFRRIYMVNQRKKRKERRRTTADQGAVYVGVVDLPKRPSKMRPYKSR